MLSRRIPQKGDALSPQQLLMIRPVVPLRPPCSAISLTAHGPDHSASGRGAPPYRSAACRGDTTHGRAGSARDAEAVRVGETGVMSGILARGGRGRLADMSEEQRQRVVGVPVDGTASPPRVYAFPPAQHSQPPVAVEHLAGLLAIGPAHKGQPRLHLDDEAIRWWARNPAGGPRARCGTGPCSSQIRSASRLNTATMARFGAG